MQINSPTWWLKKRCPCCMQGYLELHTCNHCGRIVAICEEVGTLFPDVFDLSNIPSDQSHDTCPACHTQGSLLLSKDTELIAIGLTTDDYE